MPAITQFDRRTRKVALSIKALEVAEEKEAIAQYGSSDSGATLGDILGTALRSARARKRSREGRMRLPGARGRGTPGRETRGSCFRRAVRPGLRLPWPGHIPRAMPTGTDAGRMPSNQVESN